MIENTGYAAFNLYHSLSLHFKGKYDYIKYGGKTTMSQDKFAQRGDKYFFYRLSRKYNFEELKGFYIANFLVDPNVRPGPLELQPADEIYKIWLAVTGSLKYKFTSDLEYLFENYRVEDTLKVKNGQFPLLLKMVMDKTTNLETLIILNEILNFFPMWTEKINDDIIWPAFKLKCEKYAPFLNYDRKVYKDIVKQMVEDYT